ncbi:PDDEXK nuclease domain-containing protein [Chitinophaga lutea]
MEKPTLTPIINELETASTDLFKTVAGLLDSSKARVAQTVNTELSMLYWNVGGAINAGVLQYKRGAKGEELIGKLAEKMTATYGRGWSKRQLWFLSRFASVFNREQLVNALRSLISWTHLRLLCAIEDPDKRAFYLTLCGRERWSTRVLQERIDSMLYERTGLSRKPEKLLQEELSKLENEGPVTPDLVFRDPYVLDFLGLTDAYSEADLETGILRELQHFIVELGSDFAFLARQKRIIIDNEDFKIDLLFYHRGLRRLVVIELKMGQFKAAYKGQMELYLKWLDRYERKPGEESPIGLILCTEKKPQQIELLELDAGHIKVAEYLTQLPPKEQLLERVAQAIANTRHSKT